MGRIFSPHMLRVDWTGRTAGAHRESAHENLKLSRRRASLHYAVLRGMKPTAATTPIRLFRPDLNARRMTSSLQRLAMRRLTKHSLALLNACEVEGWVPRGEGHSMYWANLRRHGPVLQGGRAAGDA